QHCDVQGRFYRVQATFSDQGANRLGASALMQGLADGYFILPYTMANYLADAPTDDIDHDHPAVVQARQEVESRIETLLSIDGERTVGSFRKELGHIAGEYC